MSVVDPNHVLPRTFEWNVALERALGKADVLTVTYLGAAGRKLMRRDRYNAPNPNFTGMFNVLWNGSDSSYEALQAQFRHRLAHGLQTLFSYTWAHAIDDASSDAYPTNLPANYALLSQERGSSDYDIGTHSPAQFPLTFPRRPVENGKRYLGAGQRIRSFTLAARPR